MLLPDLSLAQNRGPSIFPRCPPRAAFPTWDRVRTCAFLSSTTDQARVLLPPLPARYPTASSALQSHLHGLVFTVGKALNYLN